MGQPPGYVWDAASNRIERTVNGTVLDYVDGTRTEGGFSAGNINTTDLRLGGVHVNTYVGTSTTYFNHQDHLGDTRTQTDPTGAQNGSFFEDLPFGDWNGNNIQGNDLFAGDALLDSPDSDMYQMPYRRYDEYTAQWQSPDPAGMAAVDITNPQSWNRYAYVGNNPMSFVDPTGLEYEPTANLIDGMMGYYGGASSPCALDDLSTDCGSIGSGLGSNAIAGVLPTGCYSSYCETQNGDFFPISQQSNGSYGGCGGSGYSYFCVTFAANNGFTLGVRAPGQTWTQCMSANSGNYSIAGAFNLQSEGAKFALGNDVSQLLFGNTAEGTGGLALWEGGSRSFEAGVGSVMTAGRRTASIMDLNLAGTTGPAPMILGKTGAEQAAGWLSGLAEIKMAIDVGLTGAQAIGCAIHR